MSELKTINGERFRAENSYLGHIEESKPFPCRTSTLLLGYHRTAAQLLNTQQDKWPVAPSAALLIPDGGQDVITVGDSSCTAVELIENTHTRPSSAVTTSHGLYDFTHICSHSLLHVEVVAAE